MALGGGFRRLTRVLRRLEETGWTIECVRSAGDDGFCSATSIRAIVFCRYGGTDAPSPPHTESLGLADHPVALSTRSIETTVRGVKAELGVTVDVPEATTPKPRQTNSGTPLHRDQDRLCELYRTYPTFVEMAEAVEEDVSAETIRRYTIEHGIHEPGSGAIGRGPIVADGMGVNADVPPGDLIDAVAAAQTVYEVQQNLDLDRNTTTSLLRQLGLIDLVTGRLDAMSDHDAREREIRDRLSVYDPDGRSHHRNG